MDVIRLTQELVAIPSEAGPNETYEQIATFIKNVLQDNGIASELLVCPLDKQVIQPEWDIKKLHTDNSITNNTELFCSPQVSKYNVVGHIGQGEPHVLIHAHLDTVPCPSYEEWIYPPYEGVIVDNKLYGLGAADNKSGIAIAIAAAIRVKEHLKKGTISLVFTADEEVGGYAGAGYLVKENLIQGDVVCSTNGMMHKINTGCWGRLWANIYLEKDDEVLELFKHNINKINENFTRSNFPAQIVRMSYGDNLLAMVFNIFSMERFDYTVLSNIIKDTIAVENISINYDRLLEVGVNREDKYAQVMEQVVEEVLGVHIPLMLGSSSDLRFFLHQGINGLAFGPIRTFSQIHKPNEHVLLEDLAKCTLVLTQFMKKVCMILR